MAQPEWVESVKPLKNLFIGIGIPAAVMVGCAAAGMLLALAVGGGGRPPILAGAYFGALLGFFASFYGLAELLIGFFFSTGPVLDRACRSAGYLAAWSAAAGAILYYR